MQRFILFRVYLAGYQGKTLPRSLRKLIAKSLIHRAWLAGYLGFFEEQGIQYGPARPYPQI